jgi:hypothetical protein
MIKTFLVLLLLWIFTVSMPHAHGGTIPPGTVPPCACDPSACDPNAPEPTRNVLFFPLIRR